MSCACPTISIVVPCWHDRDIALQCAQAWTNHAAVKEIILAGVIGAEPGSDFSHLPNVKWCAARRPSRGEQMNLGAGLATADALLFHHVDSELTSSHLDAVVHALGDSSVVGGGFYRKFDQRHPSLLWLEKIERVHSRAFGTIYGDQSIFVRRQMFARLGGFAAIPLMEDVAFSSRLRHAGKIALLDPPMRSSSQRQIEQGAWRVTLRNLSFLIAFRCGVPPERLHRWYYRTRSTQAILPSPRVTAEIAVTK